MAAEFQVSGPCDIYVNYGDASSWSILGRTSNEALPRTRFNYFLKRETSVASGMAPEQAVNNNGTIDIDFALVVWDTVVLGSVADRLRGTSGDVTFAVGTVSVANPGGHTIGIRIVPRIAGRLGIEMACCLPAQNPFTESEYGNCAKVLGCSFEAIPDPDTGLLYETFVSPPG